jgi:hypothetical protein
MFLPVTIFYVVLVACIITFFKTHLKWAKVTASIISLVLGWVVLAIWGAGSHGHMMIRPQMIDWILLITLIISLGIPVLFIIQIFAKKNTTTNNNNT